MNRIQLEHVIRACGEITGSQDIIIVGSQSILGQFPEIGSSSVLPNIADDEREKQQDILLRSMEVNVIVPGAEEKSDIVDGAIGELSSFHHAHGYYAQGVDSTTALLPQGWDKRLVIVCNENTSQVRGHCLEIHDLLISKLYAGRQKDYEFFQAANSLGLVKQEVLFERLECSSMPNDRKRVIHQYISKDIEK